MNFTKLQDDDYQAVWITELVDYGDFPLRYALRLEYTQDWGDCENWWDGSVRKMGKYHVTLCAVSVAALSSHVRESLLDQFDGIEKLPDDQLHAEAIQFGAYVPLWQESGDNKGALLAAARKEFEQVQMLFGFYMDKPVNAIGATGWDFIRGESLPETYELREIEQD